MSDVIDSVKTKAESRVTKEFVFEDIKTIDPVKLIGKITSAEISNDEFSWWWQAYCDLRDADSLPSTFSNILITVIEKSFNGQLEDRGLLS